MNNEDISTKLKSILISMHSELKFEDFCDILEKDFSGKMTFTQLKESLDKHYPKTNRNDKIFLLKNINLDVTTGMINIYQLFDYIEKKLEKKLYSITLVLYSISYTLEREFKISTLEFIYKLSLTMDKEININEFYNTIGDALKLDDVSSIMIFKGLDYNKKGKIRVEDFVLVIDSYREDILTLGEKDSNTQNLSKDENNFILNLKNFLDECYLTPGNIFEKIEMNNLNYVEYGIMMKTLKEELLDSMSNVDKTKENQINECIKNVLNLLKKEGNKIFQEDFENLIKSVQDNTDNPNKTQSNTQHFKINLNDVQLYWINKYLLLLEGVNLTDKMAFDMAKDPKTNILQLENLKKKIKLISPVGRISALDLNTMIEALDINKKKFLTLTDYEGLMEVIKNSKAPIHSEEKNLNENKKSDMNRSLMNTWVRGSKSVNYLLLPVKGNFKVLEKIRKEVVNSLPVDQQNNLSNKTKNSNVSNITSKNTKNSVGTSNKKQKNPLIIQEEELNADQSAPIINEIQTGQIKNKNQSTHQLQDEEIQKLLLEKEDDSDLIETLENFTINDPQGIVPSYNLFYFIQTRLADEDFPRSKVSLIIKSIDKNFDGFISYNDILSYLLHIHKHRSTKLAFKAMASKILLETKMETEQFFSSYGIELDSELTVNFLCEILDRIFNFENPISKKIYEEMRVIYSAQKSKITINELIDLIEEFKQEICENKNQINDPSQSKTILSMKEFEDSLRRFVLNLIDDDTSKLDVYNSKQNLKKFRENLKCAVRLEKTMNLQQFKDSFIKPLRMDMNLGIAVFQLIKIFSHKDEQLISQEDLITFLESYLDYDNNKLNENLSNSNFDVSNIVEMLENSGCPLKFILDNIPYNKNGFISCVDFIQLMEKFYPSFNKSIFYKLLPELDQSRHGFIYYENLQNFLYENSRREKFSILLEIKKMASAIDQLEIKRNDEVVYVQRTSLDYFSNLNLPTQINNYNLIKKNEHFVLTDRLCSNQRMKEEIFQFLCRESGNNNGYDITLLCEMIDIHRDINLMMENTFNIINSQGIDEEETFNEIINEIQSLLNSNKSLNFDKFLEKINLGEKGELSVIEIIKNFSLNLDKNKISIFIRSLDKNKTGSIPYPDFHYKLKDLFKDKYIGNINLNAKFIFLNFIKEEFNSDIKNFIFSKLSTINNSINQGLNQLLTKENFSSLLLDLYFNDILLFNQFFNFYSEKSMKNKGMINLQKFYEYIRENNKEYLLKSDLENNTKSQQNPIDEELDNNVFHFFNEIEEKKLPMKNFFDFFNVNSVSQYGCLSNSEIRKIFKEKLNIPSEEEIENSIRMFGNKNDEFHLLKMAEYVLINCEKSHIEIPQLITKMKNSIIKFNINQYDQFLKKFSLKKEIELKIKEMVLGFAPIFKLSNFECFILYIDCLNLIKSNYTSDKKITIDFIFSNYNLTEAFKGNVDQEEKNKNSVALESSLKNSLTKLSDFFEKEKDKVKLFKSFDSDKNGILTTEEFLNALKSFNDKDLNLNESQRVQLIKVADKDKDGKVNYNEFLEFLKIIKNEGQVGNTYNSKNKNDSNLNLLNLDTKNKKANPKGFIPKIEIDFKKLKINYEMNSRKIDPKSSDKLGNYLYILQEDFFTNFNKFENIEQDFNTVDENLGSLGNMSYNIEKEKFLLVLKKRLLKIDPQTVEKIISFAHEGMKSKERSNIESEGLVNYKNFLMNLMNFRVTNNINNMSSTKSVNRVNVEKSEKMLPPPGCPPKGGDEMYNCEYDDDEQPQPKAKTKVSNVVKKKIAPKKNQQNYEDNNYNDEEEQVQPKKVIRPNTAVKKNNQTLSSTVQAKKNKIENLIEEEQDQEEYVSQPQSIKKTVKNNSTQNSVRPKTSTNPVSTVNNNKKSTLAGNAKKSVKQAPVYEDDQGDNYNEDNNIYNNQNSDQENEEIPPKPINKKSVPIAKKATPASQVNKNLSTINTTISTNSRANKKTTSIPKKQSKPQPISNYEDYNEEDAEIEVKTQASTRKNAVDSSSASGVSKIIKRKFQYGAINEPEVPKSNRSKNIFYAKILKGLQSKFDFTKLENIEKAQTKMSSLFSCKTDLTKNLLSTNTQTSSPILHSKKSQNIIQSNFQHFIGKLNNFSYQGYNYQLVPERDYFKRPDGTIVPTILNSEDAAIKKCEEIWDSLKDGELYFDRDFGSQPNDKGSCNKFSLYLNGAPQRGGTDPNLIEWYRMDEISRDATPVFVDDGVETNDVMQGALGDCWFISALSVLATKDHLLRGEFSESILKDGNIDDEEYLMLSTGVYPPLFHGFRKKNIFCLRFFKNFKWRYIIIDDRLPCKKIFNDVQVPKLIYGKCRNESEFWVPLIEKAYAKLHGSYESLISGFIDDGLVDLTSFVARKYVISQDEKSSNVSKSDELWNLLKENCSVKFADNKSSTPTNASKAKVVTRNNTMMGCSVDAKVVESEVIYLNRKCGILAGHAYGILDAFEIPKPHGKKRKFSRLVRVRNPWGFKEWNGKFSDESEELEKNKEKIENVLKSKYIETQEKIILDREDGTFLMCFHDFRQIFSKIFMCYDFPASIVGIRYYDKWTVEQSGGIPINNTNKELNSFAKNPQFYLRLEKDCTVNFALMQNDGRMTKSKFPYSEYTKKACLIIAKTNSKERMNVFNNDMMVEISPVRQHREISIQKNMAKGEYLIIPSIFKEGECGDFCLEVYFPDEIRNFTSNDKNTLRDHFNDKLTFNQIEKLGNIKAKCEIIVDDHPDQTKSVNEMKRGFIYSQFQNMLIDMEENGNTLDKKEGGKTSNDRKSKKNVKKEDDWDEY
jgi:Ca2+-binding EF-hand superfamily protein